MSVPASHRHLLEHALREGDLRALQLALESGAPLELVQQELLPEHAAKQPLASFKLLLQKFHPDLQQGWWRSLAYDLASEGATEHMQALLDAAPEVIEYRTPHNGRTLFMRAIRAQHYEFARMLLTRGANPAAMDNFGRTALCELAIYSPSLTTVEEIGSIILAAAPDRRQQLLDPAVVSAAEWSSAPVLVYTLGSGASPRACDEQGMSALAWAVKEGFAEGVKLILEAGASVEDIEAIDPKDVAAEIAPLLEKFRALRQGEVLERQVGLALSKKVRL